MSGKDDHKSVPIPGPSRDYSLGSANRVRLHFQYLLISVYQFDQIAIVSNTAPTADKLGKDYVLLSRSQLAAI